MSGSHNLRALTVKDPYATLIAVRTKQIETRHLRTRHRGPIAIHSSMAFSREDQARCSQEAVCSALERAGIRSSADMPRGAIIAVAAVVGCDQVPGGHGREGAIPPGAERSSGSCAPGRCKLGLQGAHRLPQPVPCRGCSGCGVSRPRYRRPSRTSCALGISEWLKVFCVPACARPERREIRGLQGAPFSEGIAAEGVPV